MKTRIAVLQILFCMFALLSLPSMRGQQAPASGAAPTRPLGPCDIYASAGDPCVAAHSTTRALFAAYNGPLYRVVRQSDGKALEIRVVPPVGAPNPDAGGYADSAAQDQFCVNTYCWISTVFDQSPKHNDLTQAPRGGFSGPALGGFNNVPLADAAPITISGHKVYGVFIAPGMGLRQNDTRGTAVDDQAEGQYWIVNGKHFNAGCCFDYGNAEIDSRDDDNGTMETAYFGNATPWYSGSGEGPWIMTDQENNLVGCVKQDASKGCTDLPSIPFRFVTAIAKGQPHRWASLGGDAQKGSLKVMFDGPRVNLTYDPMRKQGAILLGNGGDNSDGSQGTFYEGAITAAGTFPSDATDNLVQANIVAARYDVAPLVVAPDNAVEAPTGLQTFAPGSTRNTVLSFTNITTAPVKGLQLKLSLPDGRWTSFASGTSETSKAFDQPIPPGGTVSATFKVTSGPAAFQGDLVGEASWTNASGSRQVEMAAQKVRNTSPIKINEYRVRSGGPANATDSFIELYNAGSESVDLTHWTLTEHPAHEAVFSAVEIPAGTRLAAGGFYLLGLSNSGLAVPARAGEGTLHVRSTEGMSVGDTIHIGDGSGAETRKIATLGSAASDQTTVWQPLPDGPVITIKAGATNLPVESVAGFTVGQKIALGHGTTYPAVANTVEKYEVATVTAVGKPGTQAYLAVDAHTGENNIKVTSVSDLSVGDKIRLDIGSVGHGIETATVTHIGTVATKTNLSANAMAGGTRINVRRSEGFAVGDKILVGTPASQESVTVTAMGSRGRSGVPIDIKPALTHPHVTDEWVVSPGAGVDLAAPLKYNHAANLPFSDRGTGITFEPATAFAHSSNEPVQALGTGITLDKPLAGDHAIHEVVRDEAVKTAGYQGTPAPNQWFGGPELMTRFPIFGRTITIEEGSMVLRDASGVVADSLNYGAIADPWAAEGSQAASGSTATGCYAPAPASMLDLWSIVPNPVATNTSGGRFPNGADTDSNCNDFLSQTAASLSRDTASGETNIKVDSVEGFATGQKISVDSGSNRETAVIATVGTAGATSLRNAIDAQTTNLPAAGIAGFKKGEAITIDSGANAETAIVSSTRSFGGGSIIVTAPVARAHAAGVQISGSGITLSGALSRPHARGTQVSDDLPTPGGPNQYHRTQP